MASTQTSQSITTKKASTQNRKPTIFIRWLTVLMLFVTASVNAQQVTLTATIGTTAGSYTTLKGAFDKINDGTHQGIIVISINASTAEGTTPATLNSSLAGLANYTSISIRPTADGLSISGNPTTGFGVIQLNGADNVTIDGDNAGTIGTNRNLSIINTVANTTSGTSCVRLIASTSVAQLTSCTGNTIKNCIITGSATGRNISSATSTSGPEHNTYGIVAGAFAAATNVAAPLAITSVSTTVGTGALYTSLIIDNNQIDACARGIAVLGSATSVANLLSVTNNIIGSATAANTTTVYSRGMTLQGFDNCTISGNTVRNMESFIGTSMFGIALGEVSSSGTNATVEKNNIIHIDPKLIFTGMRKAQTA